MDVLTHPTQIAAWLAAHPEARIIGIVGPPGSGKTTVASELMSHGLKEESLREILLDPAVNYSALPGG